MNTRTARRRQTVLIWAGTFLVLGALNILAPFLAALAAGTVR